MLYAFSRTHSPGKTFRPVSIDYRNMERMLNVQSLGTMTFNIGSAVEHFFLFTLHRQHEQTVRELVAIRTGCEFPGHWRVGRLGKTAGSRCEAHHPGQCLRPRQGRAGAVEKFSSMADGEVDLQTTKYVHFCCVLIVFVL